MESEHKCPFLSLKSPPMVSSLHISSRIVEDEDRETAIKISQFVAINHDKSFIGIQSKHGKSHLIN